MRDVRISPLGNTVKAVYLVTMAIPLTGAIVNVSDGGRDTDGTVTHCKCDHNGSCAHSMLQTCVSVCLLQPASVTAMPACVIQTMASVSAPPKASKETAAICEEPTHTFPT